jgi:hypothetical protein
MPSELAKNATAFFVYRLGGENEAPPTSQSFVADHLNRRIGEA